MTRVFISFSHKDDQYRNELENHLSILKRKNLIDTWSDRRLLGGDNWGNIIATELLEAKIILLLVSVDFLASNYCYDVEMLAAMERNSKNEAIVIPIILRPCDWKDTPFAICQALPTDGKSVKEWKDIDEAYLNIVFGIKRLLSALQSKQVANYEQSLNLIMFNDSLIKDDLSEIKQKVLVAESERDFRQLLGKLNEYKKKHPLSLEAQELTQIIHTRLDFETRKQYKIGNSNSLLSPHKRRQYRHIVLTEYSETRFIVIIITIMIIIWVLLIRYF